MPDSKPTVAFQGRYLDVIWAGGAEYTHNRRSRGVVLVVPLTDAGEVVFLEQHRVALKGPVIEYPAGLVGDEEHLTEESFEAAARRELLEESGYEAGALEYLLRGPSSPGSSTEVVAFYLAPGARKVHDGGGVGHERIRVHGVKLDDVDAWLDAKTQAGVLVDPRVYLGVHYAKARWRGQ